MKGVKIIAVAILTAVPLVNGTVGVASAQSYPAVVEKYVKQGYSNVINVVYNGITIYSLHSPTSATIYNVMMSGNKVTRIEKAMPNQFLNLGWIQLHADLDEVNGTTYINYEKNISFPPLASASWMMKHRNPNLDMGNKILVPLKVFEKTFTHPFHAIWYPNVNPVPTTKIPWTTWAKAVTQANAVSDNYSNMHYSPLATKTQWFPDKKDIFYNKVFPVWKYHNDEIIQQNPRVIFQTGITGWSILEYVGVIPSMGETLWKGEQVNAKTGRVINISNVLGTMIYKNGTPGFFDPKLSPVEGQGTIFKADVTINGWNGGINYEWAAGQASGLDIVPYPNWNPHDVPQPSNAADTNNENMSNVPQL